MSLTVEIRHALDDFRLDVAVKVGGGLTALVGPSGAGKTTLLNVVAGLIRPDHALVELDGKRLVETASATWVPPHERRIGYVFQEARLLPHLTVRQNLLYARWVHSRERQTLTTDEVVSLLNLAPLLDRYPPRLSGGEKQRVALGRALLSDPRLLLLDEPLASVDASHRSTILPCLDRIRADHAIPAIYVTHTWSEVASRADQVVELRAGHVAFAGSVTDAEAWRVTEAAQI